MTIGKFRIYCLGFSLHTDLAVMYGTEMSKLLGMNQIKVEFVRKREHINYAEALAIWMFPCDYRDDDDRRDVENGARIHGTLIERFQIGKQCLDSEVFAEKYAEYKKTHPEG